MLVWLIIKEEHYEQKLMETSSHTWSDVLRFVSTTEAAVTSRIL